MKHIRTFEKYRVKKNREEIIKESVLQVNDIYKVKTMIDIPQSLINAYVKKVKDTTGKNLRQFFGDVDIAEEIVKYINMNFLDVEKIPGGALMGGGQSQNQDQVQNIQDQPMNEEPAKAQTKQEIDEKPQVQVQTQNQNQVEKEEEEFEEPKKEEEVKEEEKLPEEEEKEETQEKKEEGQEEKEEGEEQKLPEE